MHYQRVERCFNTVVVSGCIGMNPTFEERFHRRCALFRDVRPRLPFSLEAIRRYMESLVPLVERGGYIPFCDHRCPPNVKPADYLYYLDLKERMFGIDGPLYGNG
jgi:hypothetical protein